MTETLNANRNATQDPPTNQAPLSAQQRRRGEPQRVGENQRRTADESQPGIRADTATREGPGGTQSPKRGKPKGPRKRPRTKPAESATQTTGSPQNGNPETKPGRQARPEGKIFNVGLPSQPSRGRRHTQPLVWRPCSKGWVRMSVSFHTDHSSERIGASLRVAPASSRGNCFASGPGTDSRDKASATAFRSLGRWPAT